MNYFDRLARIGLPPTPFTNTTPTESTYGASPLPAFLTPLTQREPEPDPFADLADDGQYQEIAQQQHAPVQQPAQMAPAPVQQPTLRLPEDVYVPATPEGDQTPVLSEEAQKRTLQFNTDIAYLVNAGASREQIMARVMEERKVDPHADVIGLDDVLAWRAKNRGVAIGVGIQANSPPPPPAKVYGEDRGTAEAALDGAADSILLGGKDELAGFLRATANSAANLVGKGTGESWSDAYARERDAERGVSEDAQHYRPGTHLTGQIAGGLLTVPIGGGEAALARGGVSAAARLAGEGAALGGIYGFNSSDGDLSDRLENAGKGAALGAGTSVVLGGPLNAVARRVAANRATPSKGREILDAAGRLSLGNGPGAEIRPLAAHTSNGGIASEASALLQPTITGGRLGGLNHAMETFADQAEATARRIADDAAGGPSTDLSAVAARANDSNVPGSLAAHAADTEGAARQVYLAAETAANGAQVHTPSTINRIDEILGEWDGVPGGVPGADTLRALRNELAQGPNGGSTSAQWSIDGLRRLRTAFGDRIESGQRQLREAANRLWGPLSDDIFRGLRVAGRPDAARLYRQADRQWAQRAEGMAVIERVIGRDADLSADAVASRINAMSRNDAVHLGRALNLIDPAQANALRGGLINSLGEQIASRATRADEFSLESFATRWSKMSAQARAAIFAPATVRDLDDLARLAGSQRRTNRLGNSSRSGVTNENWRQMRAITAEGAALTAGVWNPAVWLSLAGTTAAGRLLATPGFARALVRGSQSRSLEVLTRRLAEVARRTPGAAQDIAGFETAVRNGSNNSMSIQTGRADPFAGLPTDQATEIPAATAPEQSGDDPFAGLDDDGNYVEF